MSRPAKTDQPTEHWPPLLFRPGEAVDLKAAVHISGRDEKTVRRLCREYGIARQSFPGAPLEIHRVGLEMALHGDRRSIALLRGGFRDHPVVELYFTHCGAQPCPTVPDDARM